MLSEERYPAEPRPAIVDSRLVVFNTLLSEERYPAEPRPFTVDSRLIVFNALLNEETYPADPRPSIVDCNRLIFTTLSSEEIYPAEPRPFTVEIPSVLVNVINPSTVDVKYRVFTVNSPEIVEAILRDDAYASIAYSIVVEIASTDEINPAVPNPTTVETSDKVDTNSPDPRVEINSLYTIFIDSLILELSVFTVDWRLNEDI